MKYKKIMSTLLITGLLTANLFGGKLALANDLGSTSEITKEENGNFTIITQNNKQIRQYTSTDSSTKNGSKMTVDANFVDDKFSSEMTTILSLKGFIPSNRQIIEMNKNIGIMKWPVKYAVKVKNLSLDNEVKIADSTPKNAIATSEVNNTISYSIGGGIEISKGAANGNYAISKSISYEQPEYNTIQLYDTNSSVAWETNFASTKKGYKLSDWDLLWGNAMFMVSGTGNTSTTNFHGTDELSSLISGGFSPNVGLALIAPNGTKKSKIEVTLVRKMNSYYMNWIDTHWQGANYPSVDGHSEEKMIFEIDWENHKIKSL